MVAFRNRACGPTDMAGVWEAATLQVDGRVDVDGGDDWVRFLAPQFRQNDGSDFGTVGYGIDVIEEEP